MGCACLKQKKKPVQNYVNVGAPEGSGQDRNRGRVQDEPGREDPAPVERASAAGGARRYSQNNRDDNDHGHDHGDAQQQQHQKNENQNAKRNPQSAIDRYQVTSSLNAQNNIENNNNNNSSSGNQEQQNHQNSNNNQQQGNGGVDATSIKHNAHDIFDDNLQQVEDSLAIALEQNKNKRSEKKENDGPLQISPKDQVEAIKYESIVNAPSFTPEPKMFTSIEQRQNSMAQQRISNLCVQSIAVEGIVNYAKQEDQFSEMDRNSSNPNFKLQPAEDGDDSEFNHD